MNFYPEQLRAIAAICDGLNKIDGVIIPEGLDQFTVPSFPGMVELHVGGTTVGHLVDEVGGAWSFEPLAPKP